MLGIKAVISMSVLTFEPYRIWQWRVCNIFVMLAKSTSAPLKAAAQAGVFIAVLHCAGALGIIDIRNGAISARYMPITTAHYGTTITSEMMHRKSPSYNQWQSRHHQWRNNQ